MTPGQTFYLILCVFYLLSTIKATKPNSILIQNKLIKGWSLGHPAMFLGGLQKSLCITHLLPVHSYTIFSAVGGLTPPKKDQIITRSKNVKKLISKIAYSASCLRMLSFITFYLYFVFIPIAYIRYGDTFPTYMVILAALIMPTFTGIIFVCKHRKLAPEQKDLRWKNFFYCVMMPWHAMRIADTFFLSPHFEKIHPLSFAELCSNQEANDYLSQEYRNTIFLKNSIYTNAEFEKLFSLNSFDPASYLDSPVTEGSGETQYCPCCHTLFTNQASECTDCNDLKLLSVK